MSHQPRPRSPWLPVLTTGAAAVLLAACGATASPVDDVARGHDAAGPVIALPVQWDAYPAAEVGGDLRLVHGCLVVGDDVVVWPHASEWDGAAQAVVFGSRFAGARPAEVGSAFHGGGGSYDATTDLAELVGAEAAAAIDDCLHRTGATEVVMAYPTSPARRPT